MRSLFSGVAGLKNHQTRMDVIGNNISNVNTTGYKASRVTFQDMLSQTITGSASAQGNRGGTNAKQIGLGMGTASIDTMFTDGSVQSTGKNTDLAISGAGFFILGDGSNKYYTRSGAFEFDAAGNYVVPGSGLKVQGWMADATGTINSTGGVTDIVVPVGQTMAATATTKGTYTKNLSATAASATTATTSFKAYDSEGVAHTITGTFTKSATTNEWTFAATSTDGGTMTGGSGNVTFTTAGAYSGSTVTDITFTPSTGGATATITLDFSGLTQYDGDTTVTVDKDGNTAGSLTSVSTDASGTIVGTFSNGLKKNLAQVAMATFNNPGGLTKSGTSLYNQSNNSGQAQISTAGAGGAGSLTPSSLEMSNVDLSEEFSNMIITQRGFQANSKIITVSDEMIETLVNLKR